LEVTQLKTDERSLRNRCFDSISEDLSRTAPIVPPPQR
jgi:hypothetical protein